MLAKHKKVIVTIAVVGTLVIITTTQALANLVTNGGFEDTGDYIQKHVDVPVDSDTVARWDFDEGAGTTVTDDSTNGNNGTLVLGSLGNVTVDLAWVTGITGNAITFDGTDDYVDCGSGDSLKITHSLTIEAWVKPDALGARRGIVYKNYFNEFAWMLHSGGEMRFLHGDGSHEELSSNSGVVELNEWQHVAVVRRMSDKKILFYVNGNSAGEDSFTTANITSTESVVKIGYYFWGDKYFDGAIDEVRISNVARVCPASWDVSDNLTGHLYNGCLYQTRNVTHDGTCSLKMIPTAGASTEFSTQYTGSYAEPIQNKGKYKVSGWIRTDDDYTLTADYQPKIVVQSGGNETVLTSKRSETLNTWQRYYGYITAGSTELTITLKCYGTAGSCWFDDIVLEPAPTGTLIMIGKLK